MIVNVLITLLSVQSVYCSDGWTTPIVYGKMIDHNLYTTPFEWKTKVNDGDESVTEMVFDDGLEETSGGFKLMLRPDKTVAHNILGCHTKGADMSLTGLGTFKYGVEMKWRITRVASGNDVFLKIHCDDKVVLDKKLAAPYCQQFSQKVWERKVEGIKFVNPGLGVKSETGYRAYTAPTCPAGNYNDDGLCKKCPKNTYSAEGAESCTDCPPGHPSEEGSTSKDACQKHQAPSRGDSFKSSALLLSFGLLLAVNIV